MLRSTIRFTQTQAAIAVLAIAALSAPAQAGLFDDDEARRRIDQLRTQVEAMQQAVDGRFGKLEAEVADRRVIVDLASQIDSLRDELSRMRGSLEVLTNQIEQQEKRSRDLYIDADNRLRKIEQARLDDQKSRDERGAAAPGTTGSPGPSGTPERPAAVDTAIETRAYEAALNQFKLASYKDAIGQFQNFLAQYPQSQLAPSAQYWIGNSYYALRDYRAAISAQERVLRGWPDNAKAPDAMLNIASCQAELGDRNSERQTLRALVDQFPRAPAADQARQRLARR